MIVKQRAVFLLAGMVLGVSLTSAPASAADMDAMATKAPPYAVAPTAQGPVSCSSLWGFFVTDCQLLWSGVRLYGTVDLGGLYQTHGTPFDKNFPTGASYIAGCWWYGRDEPHRRMGSRSQRPEPVDYRCRDQRADRARRLGFRRPRRTGV